MRKISFLVFAMMLFLVGCNNASPNEESTTDKPMTDTSKEEEVVVEDQTDYGFSEFDLDIDVENDTVIKVEYDADESDFDAKFENKNDNVKLEKDAAMDEIDTFFKAISVSKDFDDEQIVDAILKYFDLNTFTEFELEIDFNDGTKKDIDIKKQ